MDTNEKRNSSAQSLFQIYYLGHTPVDRRCSSAVMPWVIEELKLKAEEMRLIWLSPAPEGVSYVADNGEEMFTHTYGSIVRCCIAVDGVSFAYTAHHEKDRKYYCHVFQALTFDEASLIMQKFKENAKEEGGGLPDGESEERFTELAKLQSQPGSAINRSACEYHLSYLGNMEVGGLPSGPSQVDIIDRTLQRMRDERQKRGRKRRRLKRIGKSRNSSQVSLSSVDSIDYQNPPSASVGSTASTSELSEATRSSSSTSSLVQSLSSLGQVFEDKGQRSAVPEEGGEEDIAIKVTRATPEREGEEEGEREEEEEEEGEREEGMERISEEREVREREEDEGGGELASTSEESLDRVLDETSLRQKGRKEALGMGDRVTGILEKPNGGERVHSWIDESGIATEELVVTEPTEATGVMQAHLHQAKQQQQGQEHSKAAAGPIPALGIQVHPSNLQSPSPGQHNRQQSYEIDEATFLLSDHLSGDEGPLPPELSMKRFVTVHSVGGSVVNTAVVSCGEGQWERVSVLDRPPPVGFQTTMEGEEGRVEEMRGFDTLPELQSLQQTAEFQALGQPSELPGVEVKLVFSGLSVSVFSEGSGELVLRRTVRTIAVSAQGKRESDCIGFISREGAAKKFFCHLFRAESDKMASAVLESFKSSFVHALSVTQPAALCDTCPLQQLHDLCQTIEGVSTQVAQSRIQECMATLSEQDYAAITKQYKESEHADHEYTQLVVLLALIRRHFQKKQGHHTHTTASQLGLSSDSVVLRQRANSGSKPSRISALERAKMALATSFDNLRGRATERRNARSRRAMSINQQENAAKATEVQGEEKASQSINLPPLSPLFPRRSDFETLASPAQSLAKGKTEQLPREGEKEEREREGRDRSGSFRIYKRSLGESSGEASLPENAGKKAGKGKRSRLLASDAGKPSALAGSGDEEKLDSTGSAVSSCSASPQPSPPPSPPKIDLLSSQSFPSTAVFKTPSRTSLHQRKTKHPYRRAKTGLPTPTQRHAFTPNPTSTVSPSFKMGHRRSLSWRQDMFELCATPNKGLEDRRTSIQALVLEVASIDQLGCKKSRSEENLTSMVESTEWSPRSRSRDRWRRAIQEQILLNRIEAANQSLMEASTEAKLKRLKLCYTDSSLDPTEAGQVWTNLLSQTNPSAEEVHRALILGVPPSRRGEVWRYLVGQYLTRHEIEPELPFASPEMLHTYCQESTQYEHNIQVDLGRTFPSHPYFNDSRKLGQTDLYKVLRAYAVADPEIGYCQGLSFVTGMILMHMKDEEASYLLLCQLMHHYDYREVYTQDLSSLQIRLYQLSRLIHDFLPDLYQHLRQYEVPPFFYAAPWFLTLFASQYPIVFVARFMDLFFYEGPEVIFKVILTLLHYHQDFVLQCRSMEAITHYLKEQLPAHVLDNMPTIFSDALRVDLGSKLQAFETEYQIMAELTASFQIDMETPPSLESLNNLLKKQNRELIEQLAICRGSIQGLESTVSSLQAEVDEQRDRIQRLEGP